MWMWDVGLELECTRLFVRFGGGLWQKFRVRRNQYVGLNCCVWIVDCGFSLTSETLTHISLISLPHPHRSAINQPSFQSCIKHRISHAIPFDEHNIKVHCLISSHCTPISHFWLASRPQSKVIIISREFQRTIPIHI